MVTPDYFPTFGIRLVKGRAFTDQDTAASVKVAMVNESFVKKFFKRQGSAATARDFGGAADSRSSRSWGRRSEWQIVGVYHNVHAADQREDNGRRC